MQAERLARIAFWLNLAVSAALLVVPIYTGSAGRATLWQVNGAWILIPLAVPVLIAGAPLVWPRRATRIAAAALLLVYCLISFSIGLFYWPATVLMILAAMLS